MFRPSWNIIKNCQLQGAVTKIQCCLSLNRLWRFFIIDFDWSVVKVFCSLQDFVKQDDRLNCYYLISCVYFRKCEPDEPVWPVLSFLLWRNSPQWARASSLARFRNYTKLDTPHSLVLLWTSDQPVDEPSTWQHTTLTTNIHAPGGIRTRIPCKRSGADPRLIPRGHWDWLLLCYIAFCHRVLYTSLIINSQLR